MPPPPPLLGRLREATRAQHASVEQAYDLLAPDATEATYVAFLGALHGFLKPLEREVERLIGVPARRGARIAADLQALGHDPASLPCWEAPGEVTTAARAFGARYLLEGSALGARVIHRHLVARLPETMARASAYLLGDAAGREGWDAFVAELAAKDDREAPEIVRGAQASFEALVRWMEAWKAREP